MAQTGEEILAGAKSALNHADETQKYYNPTPAPVPVPEGLKGGSSSDAAPKHEYSNTPYSMANDAIKSIKARREQERKALE